MPRRLNIGFGFGPLTLTALTGVFQLQAPAADLSVSASHTLSAGAGMFTLAGQAATLTFSGLVLPGQVPGLSVRLQGQTTTNNTPVPPTPTAPNSQTLGWSAPTFGTFPFASYNVYRTAANGSTFSLYASGITGTTYTDSAATLCVNGTAGAAPPYYKPNTYLYGITAVDTHGNEGPQSPVQSAILYANGSSPGIAGDFDAGVCTVDYANTTLPANGSNTKAVKCTLLEKFGYWIPYWGNEFTQYNLAAGAFNFLQMDFYVGQAGSNVTLLAYVAGDKTIYSNTGVQYQIPLSSYGTIVVGGWVHLKFPLGDFITDYGASGAGPPVQETALYKIVVSYTNGEIGDVMGFDNLILTPT